MKVIGIIKNDPVLGVQYGLIEIPDRVSLVKHTPAHAKNTAARHIVAIRDHHTKQKCPTTRHIAAICDPNIKQR